jgi:hypothetical protein
MAAKNGCSESAQVLIVHGASLEAKTTVTVIICMEINNFMQLCFFFTVRILINFK